MRTHHTDEGSDNQLQVAYIYKLTYELLFAGIWQTIGKLCEKIIGRMGRQHDKLAHCECFGNGSAQNFRSGRIDEYLEGRGGARIRGKLFMS